MLSHKNFIGTVDRYRPYLTGYVRPLVFSIVLLSGFLFLTFHSSTPRVVEAAPPPASLAALFVVGSTTLNAGDAAIKARLEMLGLTVSVKDAVTAVSADANGKGLVVISQSVTAASVNTKFRDVAVPVVVMEALLYDDMSMVGPTQAVDFENQLSQTQVRIDDTTHQMAANLNGIVSVATTPSIFAWGVPSASALKIASLVGLSTRYALFGYETGSAMVGMNAPARRAGVFLLDVSASAINHSGWALFDAAIRWSANMSPFSMNSSAMFVVGSTTLAAGDVAIKARLESLGFTVSVKDAPSAVTADANDKGLVVISETVTSTDVNTKFRDVAVPVMVFEPGIYDDMSMTGTILGTDYENLPNQSQITITNSQHQMAANRSGTVTITTTLIPFSWGVPGGNAIKIATLAGNPNRHAIYGYETGSAMVSMSAPARRVGALLYRDTPTVLNSDGWALFDAAVRWCANRGVNVALSANGGSAISSSSFSLGYLPSGAINGDLTGMNWGSGGGWTDATAFVFPDWVQVNFQGEKTIGEIDVFTVQDAYSNPAPVTEHMTFTSYGNTDYVVQYWRDNSWWAVPYASVAGNNKVWRRLGFSNIRTDKIRVWVNDAADHTYSRIVEVEAWESQQNQMPLGNPGGPYTAAQNTAVRLNGSTSYDPDGAIANYQWNFGDGTTGTGPAPEHIYSAVGTYTVTLTVIDNGGLTSTGSTTVTIYPASNQVPVANIASSYSAIAGTATQFSASGSFDPDGSITQYNWNFTGLGTASGTTANFTFTSPGVHVVTLTVVDNWGAKRSTSANVVVTASGEQLQGDSNVSDWDRDNRRSLDNPVNDRGAPANKTTGNNNFQIVAPVLSLPGRGMDLNLNLVYNSLLWHKSANNLYFDIDHDWPAPGWHLGFGKMVTMGSGGCLLIEPDGSRHSFAGDVVNHTYPPIGFLPGVTVPAFKGRTTDGSLIEYRCEMQVGSNGTPYGVARYPNGMVVYYTNYSSDFSKPKNYIYPYLIVDANGNRINIKYLWDLREPRIERIVDTVGRVITFNYDTQKRLTSITAPGLKDAQGNAPTYTFVRLHYTNFSLETTNPFSVSRYVRDLTHPVLDAIYYPANGSGYWFGPEAYSRFGMIKKVTQKRGMGFTPGGSPNEQGTVTQGTTTRTQTYDYNDELQGLASAPEFSTIDETWDGSIASTVTTFVSQTNTSTNERTVTVTNPDGTKTVQISYSDLPDSSDDKYKDGVVKEEKRLDSSNPSKVIQRTIFTWQKGPDGATRLERTETTDERGQVLATAYDQYGENNSVGRVREFNYSGAVVRSTINTFVSYLDSDLDLGINPTFAPGVRIHPRLVNLVSSTKVFEGDDGAQVLASYTKTDFDQYSETLKAYTPDLMSSLDLFEFGVSQQPGGIAGILQHSSIFNPLPSSQSGNGGVGSTYLTKRGNITSVTRYADTSNSGSPASPVVETMKYDMAGNVISSSKDCCEEMSFNFNLAMQYAFVVSRTRGSSNIASTLRVNTSTSYDLNTGLSLSETDANGNTTQSTYSPQSLRPTEIAPDTGARITLEYDDTAMKVIETSRLSVNGTIASQRTKYFDGLGRVKREELLGAGGLIDIVETVFDEFGRPSKQSLPYRTGQTPQWRQTIYDAAGRVAEQWEPAIQFGKPPGVGNPKTRYFYNEAGPGPAGASTDPGQTTRTVDAWGRWRWARVDSAGRLAEVVEPNPAGGTGFQTRYTYNALNKLVRIDTIDQVRRFRYDSLGRLTHQKLAEKEATLDLSGQLGTANPQDRWSDVFAYDERSNLISHTDARGVKATFNYKVNDVQDPLNRLQSVSYDTSAVPAVLPAPTVNYQYRTKSDPATPIDVTQLSQVVADGVSTEAYTYDEKGRVQERQLTFAGRTQPMTTTYAFDSLGRIGQITYPAQYHDNVANPTRKIVTQTYDAASRASGLKVNNVDYASQVTYNASSQITSVLIGSGPNQVTENYTYQDLTGLLSRQTVKRGTTTLMDFSYGYLRAYCDMPGAVCSGDPEFDFHTGQLTMAVDNGPTGEGKRQLFSYDDLGRLKQARQYTWEENTQTGFWSQKIYWNQDYSYDRYGNRTAVAVSDNLPNETAVPDGLQSLSFDATSNRITSAGFTYDPAGNQLQNNNGKKFEYDAAGRLARVRDQASNAVLATYTYGSSNQRLITQTGNEASTDKTYYVWDDGSVIAEYIEQPSATMPKWQKNYIYLGGRLLATEAPNTSGEIVHYHHPDRLSTALVTNNLDTMSFKQTNLPFGTALDAGAPEVTKRRFTSYDRSTTTGLDYAVNRHYDSRQGRFTQPDRIGMAATSLADPQTFNMYAYVGNDPVNRIDPDGQFWGALFRFVAGLFRNLKPNVINGSFTYRNSPPISVSFTPNFQNIGVGFAGIGFDLRTGGHWLPAILGSVETLIFPASQGGPKAQFDLDKFKYCIDRLYNISLAPSDGRSRSLSLTRTEGIFVGSRFGNFFTITTDLTTYTGSGLRSLSPKALPPGRVAGMTMPARPYLNWLASDFVSDPRVTYQALFAAFVHEVGNSLAAISKRPSPAKDPRMFRYDQDSGNGLTECVYGGFVLPDGTITLNPGNL